ncbi:MAG: metal-sulfur cluster assembly factor, partial [Gemmatimonadaceae bacterium]
WSLSMMPKHDNSDSAPARATDAIWTALATVIDPELGLDVVTLGLVYGVVVDGDCARITYTLTTPGCPMEQIITDGVRRAVLLVEGIARADTQIVWDPAWHPGMIAPHAFPE